MSNHRQEVCKVGFREVVPLIDSGFEADFLLRGSVPNVSCSATAISKPDLNLYFQEALRIAE